MSLLVVGVVYEAVGAALDDRNFPPPGQLVDVGGYRLHLRCTGEGSPTVILESGSGMASPGWGLVQPEVARFARVCSYDRAGYGWSDSAGTARTGEQVVADLHRLLQSAGVEGPYVLVGHSLGGMYARLYADRHPDEVVGLILLDARPESFTEELVRAGEAAPPAGGSSGPVRALIRLGVARAVLEVAGVGALPGTEGLERLPEREREAMRALMLRPQLWTAAQREGQHVVALEQALKQAGPLASKPLVVIAHGQPMLPEKAEAIWRDLQEQMAALSSAGRLLVAEHSGHNIPLQAPEMVVEAIRKVVEGRQD